MLFLRAAIIGGMALIAQIGAANACSCVRPDRQLTDAEFKTWSFDRAVNVVRGQVKEVSVGSRTMPNIGRVFVAKMDVSSVVKGEAPTGEIAIVTLPGVAFNRAECGAAHVVLAAVVGGTDLVLEVRKFPESPNEFFIDLCGYVEVASASGNKP